jgi:hypothetical protein
MSWFVDKLGELPPGQATTQNLGKSTTRLLEKSGVAPPTVEVRMTQGAKIAESLEAGKAGSGQPAAGVKSEPEKKKKGWF